MSGTWSLLSQSLALSPIKAHTPLVLESVISKRNNPFFFWFWLLGGVNGWASTKRSLSSETKAYGAPHSYFKIVLVLSSVKDFKLGHEDKSSRTPTKQIPRKENSALLSGGHSFPNPPLGGSRVQRVSMVSLWLQIHAATHQLCDLCPGLLCQTEILANPPLWGFC